LEGRSNLEGLPLDLPLLLPRLPLDLPLLLPRLPLDLRLLYQVLVVPAHLLLRSRRCLRSPPPPLPLN
jgi:hypothetical protein